MQQLPIGIQTFEKLRAMNLLYIDKTKYLYRLIQKGTTYFLSRPRRFGKSLTVSTLDAIFQGKKELFKGLWIYNSDYDWKPYPVIRLDMTRISEYTGALLERCTKKHVHDIGREYGISIQETFPAKVMFEELITQLHAKHGNVVILIDEYDKPLLDHVNNTSAMRTNREFLRSFYGVMKSLDDKIRFIFLTGVSKFSQVSVFSGLNNLKDITMDTRYATMLGYTQEELEHSFAPYINQFTHTTKTSRKKLLDDIRTWYNGFRFSKHSVTVYNPFSTLLLFDQHDFRNYWFETATPDFLINLIKKQKYDLVEAEETPTSEESFGAFEIEDLNIRALLVQTGYFTIRGYDPHERLYRLGYPNKEVEIAFTRHLLGMFAKENRDVVVNDLVMMREELENEKLEKFFTRLTHFIAGIPYTVRSREEEKYYQSLLFTIVRCLGIHVDVEVTTNIGRIDATIEMQKRVYICEFKLNGTKEDALKQIKRRRYYERYGSTGKKIILIGVEINRKKRNIGAWVAEKIKN